MLAAAVSGTGLEAFGLMVLPYAISVLCTAIGIVPLMVFLAFGRENKKQRMVRILSSWLSIVLLNGVATAVYNLTGLENLYLYTAGNGRNHLRTCQKSCGVGAEAKATDVCGPV